MNSCPIHQDIPPIVILNIKAKLIDTNQSAVLLSEPESFISSITIEFIFTNGIITIDTTISEVKIIVMYAVTWAESKSHAVTGTLNNVR